MIFGGWAISKLDFDILVAVTKLLNAKKILEFGPGTSTHAFIQAGATHIDTFESDDVFKHKYEDDFSGFDCVHVHGGSYPDTSNRYDLAFVDGPKGTPEMSRIGALDYAIRHSNVVAIHDSNRKGEQESIDVFRKNGYLTYDIGTESGITFIIKQ